ncbi:hypothetical protein GCM10007377_16150 [Galliscardovia ingluviei]|uniref:Pentapeptide repeat-containing protein n=1 Tax=Galliscardovia ingluviei TaxID=1769422 RepID=A0A8J3AKW5_9BIFI|nr:pentapeptide repeat-containing protein [Galliscardovia ingluviei]GGI15488.1 hypothetical protein GCM10007377_16150 [Galliscardovia ingluviei]
MQATALPFTPHETPESSLFLHHEQDRTVSGKTYEKILYAYCTYTNMTFINVQFSSCDLYHTVFRYCTFIDCMFDGCVLDTVSFYMCELRNTGFQYSTLLHTRFEQIVQEEQYPSAYFEADCMFENTLLVLPSKTVSLLTGDVENNNALFQR